MANNLKKFNTESEYNQATLSYPAVSWVVSDDIVHFDKETPTPSFSGLTVYYNITDISQPTDLFKGAGGSGSGSGSGSGGALPSAMIIDGTAVEVTNTYQFSTTGEHIVNCSFADNQIPKNFLYLNALVTKTVIGDAITSIGSMAFGICSGLTSIISNAATAPTLAFDAFNGVSTNGVLTVPSGSQAYCDWMGKLPSGWTIEGVTCGGSGSGSGSGS